MNIAVDLSAAELAALRDQAQVEGRSPEEVVRHALLDYLGAARRSTLDRVLDTELPRYRDALRRLGR